MSDMFPDNTNLAAKPPSGYNRPQTQPQSSFITYNNPVTSAYSNLEEKVQTLSTSNLNSTSDSDNKISSQSNMFKLQRGRGKNIIE